MAEEDRNSSFFKTFRPLFVFAQLCGLMPLAGIFGRSHESLRFTWTNPMHAYAVAVSAFALFFDVNFTKENLKRDMTIDNFASTVFYTVCLLTSYLFLKLARRMPEVVKEFGRIEHFMSDYEEPKFLSLRVKLFMLVFVLLAAVEHGTMGVLHLSKAFRVAGNSTESVGEIFYVTHFPAISLVIPYSGFLTVALFWANAVCTFNWNYLDFFLIGVSLELTSKFDQITKKVTKTEEEKREKSGFWEKIYGDYDRIARLVGKLDYFLSGIIVTSFFSNLYHLSLQLLRSLRMSGSLFHKIYFYFSLSYLLLRLLSMLFSVAAVNDASKELKDVLFSQERHCSQSLRLLQRLIEDEVHLTGNRFFVINRSFAFSVIGTIATYQVVLLQFNSLAFID